MNNNNDNNNNMVVLFQIDVVLYVIVRVLESNNKGSIGLATSCGEKQ
jgi:hypothetical protein